MTREHVHIREGAGPCEIHAWPDEGLPKRLIDAMRERHGKGGINACSACVTRARNVAKRNLLAREP